MSSIYLCGQITGLSGKQARYGWREIVYKALANTDIECLSPMRHKSHLDNVQSLSPLGNPGSVMSCAKGITTRDRFDVMRSDMLFCNLWGMTRASIGCMIEFGWADAFRVPILLIMEEGGEHEHGMVQDLVGWRCSSLEEGIEVTRRILTPGL